MHQVLLLWDDTAAEAIELLRCDVEVTGPVGLQDDWPTALREASGVLSAVQYQFTRPVLEAASKLKVIGRPGIGVDNVDLAAATELGICVVNTPDAPTQPVVEKTAGWILALAHRLPWADRVARAPGWPGKQVLLGSDVYGKTLGLIGLGRVGRGVAQLCAGALGMHVVAYDPHCGREVGDLPGVELACELDDLVRRADFITLHCPLTPETRGLIGEPELRSMKRSAYLINTSRGPIVDEAALVRALEERWIAGAALDVFDVEPPAPGHPLLALDNVLLGPHFGSLTREAVSRMSMGSAEQILMVLRNERPPHLVNHEVWARHR